MPYKQNENLVLAFRYLYYVESDSPISDGVYDQLERKARDECPPESDVHGIGSSNPSSYSDEIKTFAKSLQT